MQSNNPHIIPYNSEDEPLRVPVYGRGVQMLVERASRMPSPAARLEAAYAIIDIMDRLNPATSFQPDRELTLWSHLAAIADGRLDIDFPFEIEAKPEPTRPPQLPYPGNHIRRRHYGHLIETMLAKLRHMSADTAGRDEVLLRTLHAMRRSLMQWRGASVDNALVAADAVDYTDGAVTLPEALRLLDQGVPPQRSRARRRF